MTYPGNFLRLVASGTLHTIEQWSWSISLVPDFPSDAEDPGPTEIPQALITAVENFHTSSSSSNQARLTTLKLNAIAPNGRYVSQDATVFHDYGQPGVAGGVTVQNPPQIALAISLMTGASRGLAHTGRFYIPSPSWPVQADGRITTSAAAEIAGVATDLVDAINGAVDGYRVGVASDVRGGAFREVTGVRVGRVYDTIRSRRASLQEEWVSGEPVAGA